MHLFSFPVGHRQRQMTVNVLKYCALNKSLLPLNIFSTTVISANLQAIAKNVTEVDRFFKLMKQLCLCVVQSLHALEQIAPVKIA